MSYREVKPELKKVRPGLYSFSSTPPDTTQKPFVLVHPLYKWSGDDLIKAGSSNVGKPSPYFGKVPRPLRAIINVAIRLGSSGTEGPDPYLVNLASHLRVSTGPIIVFEGYGSLNDTAAVLSTVGAKGPLYLVRTSPKGIGIVEPDVNLEEMVAFLGTFAGEEVDFGGGFYDPSSPHLGCLGGIVECFEKVTNKSANVIPGLTFN